MASSNPALSFFSSFPSSDAFDRAACVSRGTAQLDAQRAALANVSASDESAECTSFLSWADSSVSVGRTRGKFGSGKAGTKKGSKNVKYVAADVPDGVLDLPDGVRGVRVLDFSPKGGFGDDWVYAHHRDVWENLPRGCAMIEVDVNGGGGDDVMRLWGVRANRKFTGHEDEGPADVGADLYSVESEEEPSLGLVTLKENGQVVHLAARWVELPGAERQLWVLIGSKKVHAVVPWQLDADAGEDREIDFMRRLRCYGQTGKGEMRYKLVIKMGQAVYPKLSHELVKFLADNRLVFNSELLVPSGTGPIDNRTVHGIEEPTPFAFSAVFNVWHPVAGAELCLDPVHALEMMAGFGFRTVQYCVADSARLDEVKEQIAHLPRIEGAVIYHLTSSGVVRLEKAKAGAYVVIRAIREKTKWFVNGRKRQGSVGFLDVAKETRNGLRALNEATKVSGKRTYELRFPGIAVTGSELRAIGGKPRGGNACWEFPKTVDADGIAPQYEARRMGLHEDHIDRAQGHIERRIKKIDHIPLSDEERADWIAKGRAWISWLAERIFIDQWDSNKVFEEYSSNFTLFLEQYKPSGDDASAAAAAAAPSDDA